jgi:hypothetical protein
MLPTDYQPMTVCWRFSNGHSWSKEFPNELEAYQFIQTCDLQGHPSITMIGTITTGKAGTKINYLKGKEEMTC